MKLDALLDRSRPVVEIDADAEVRLHSTIDAAGRARRRHLRRLWVPTLAILGGLAVGGSGIAVASAMAPPIPPSWFAHEPAHASSTRTFEQDFALPEGDRHHCMITITVSTDTGGTANKAYTTMAGIVERLDPDGVAPDPGVLRVFQTVATTPRQRGDAAASAWSWAMDDRIASLFRAAHVDPEYHDVSWNWRHACD